MSSVVQRRVTFIQGATATGKSDLALELAEVYKGQIINCDSIQVYRHLKIGSALPSEKDFGRAPHHLFAYIEPLHEMTAGRYCDDFYAKLAEIPMDTPVFVVGGTGFYFQAIENGMFPVRKVSAELKQQILQEMETPGGPEKLYLELKTMDPAAAAKIHPNDQYRIGRALEICRTEKKSLTQVLQESVNKGPRLENILKIGTRLEKEELQSRIRQRTLKMLQMGLVEETKNILDQGWSGWAPLRSVGYKETVAYLEGQLTRDELTEQISLHTSQLTKKQRTWFQRDSAIIWEHPESGKHNIFQAVGRYLQTQTSA